MIDLDEGCVLFSTRTPELAGLTVTVKLLPYISAL